MLIVDLKLNCSCDFNKQELFNLLFKKGFFLIKGENKTTYELSLIDLHSDYKMLIGGHKNQFTRDARNCSKLGYYVKEFDLQTYITDYVEINKSKDVRCGGVMKPKYNETVEQLGAQPLTKSEPLKNTCSEHYRKYYGCFIKQPGYWSDEKLVGYLAYDVMGNYVNYSKILGHADHLHNWIMAFMHLEVLKQIELQGKRFVVYYLYHTGEKGLMSWKNRAGFRPLKLSIS